MNEPTEHEKQIARETAEKAYDYFCLGTAFSASSREAVVGEFTDAILAAITAANQQQNEDTARLDLLEKYWEVDTLGQFVLKRGRIKWSPYYQDKVTIRQAVDNLRKQDAARGVQPAAQPSEILQHACTVCGSMCHGPAAKQESTPEWPDVIGATEDGPKTIAEARALQESAPAAEQELKPCPFCGSDAISVSRISDEIVACGNVHCIASFETGGITRTDWNTRAPSPAQEKPAAANRPSL